MRSNGGGDPGRGRCRHLAQMGGWGGIGALRPWWSGQLRSDVWGRWADPGRVEGGRRPCAAGGWHCLRSRAFLEYYQEHLEYACPTEDIYLE